MHWMDARALRRKDAFRGERPWTETVLLGKRFYIPYVLTSVLLALNRIATPSLGRPNEFLLAELRDRFTPRDAYTSRLSKFCSKTSSENLYREGFPAAQQFFHTNLATRCCYWHNNRYTIVHREDRPPNLKFFLGSFNLVDYDNSRDYKKTRDYGRAVTKLRREFRLLKRQSRRATRPGRVRKALMTQGSYYGKESEGKKGQPSARSSNSLQQIGMVL
ncbi:hypothetical protein V6N11_027694 [Hibiscus sabdariffa]|uniref:Uncharacterized protein n=1 Tax=Hibiscus sabdariffa TaxID=183260 RepID=A0ABR1ZTP4_9ROSI